MPKKQSEESPEAQSERFRREAQNLIDAGELSPTEAAAGLDRIVRSAQGDDDGREEDSSGKT
ncbi:MAG: hypothetical protein WDN44_10220 [Sphingomonas sp.]